MKDTDNPDWLSFQGKTANGCSGWLAFDSAGKLVHAQRLFIVESTPPADDLEEYAAKIRASAEALPEKTMGEIAGKREARLKAQAQIAEMYRQAAVQGRGSGAPTAQAFSQALFQAVEVLLPASQGSNGSLVLKPDWPDEAAALLANIDGRTLTVSMPRGDDDRAPRIDVSIGRVNYGGGRAGK